MNIDALLQQEENQALLTMFGCVGWRESQEIEQQLDDLLLPYKVDLSLYEHIDSQALREHIERVGWFTRRW